MLVLRHYEVSPRERVAPGSCTQIMPQTLLVPNPILKNCKNFLNAKYKDSLHAAAAGLLIEWNFIPPNAPHFGGLWEAGIKSAKHHLRRTMGNHVLTFEELTTLFCQIESILNSRPIGVISKDPKDGEDLTPAHLICGMKLENFPTIENSKKNDIANCTSTAR